MEFELIISSSKLSLRQRKELIMNTIVKKKLPLRGTTINKAVPSEELINGNDADTISKKNLKPIKKRAPIQSLQSSDFDDTSDATNEMEINMENEIEFKEICYDFEDFIIQEVNTREDGVYLGELVKIKAVDSEKIQMTFKYNCDGTSFFANAITLKSAVNKNFLQRILNEYRRTMGIE